MNRVARLVTAAEAIRRQIWASLPFNVRLGEVLVRLASFATDAFGKTMYGAFLENGVTGLPDIHGKPASELDITRKPIANRLPSGYGKEFGKKAYLILMSKYRNPQLVDDMMSGFMIRFLDGGVKTLEPGTSVREAEAYVIRGLVNHGLNVIRKKKEVSDVIFSEEGEETVREIPVFDDDNAQRQLDRLLPKVRGKLRTIHPDAELYLRLAILEGYTDREIIGDPERGVPSMLTHPFSSTGKPLQERNWNTAYKNKIYAVLKEYFGEHPAAAH